MNMYHLKPNEFHYQINKKNEHTYTMIVFSTSNFCRCRSETIVEEDKPQVPFRTYHKKKGSN